MKHDNKCELRQLQTTPWGMSTPSCQCGSRAFPLCDGCRGGQHTKHRPDDRGCECDLCEPAAVAS